MGRSACSCRTAPASKAMGRPPDRSAAITLQPLAPAGPAAAAGRSRPRGLASRWRLEHARPDRAAGVRHPQRSQLGPRARRHRGPRAGCGDLFRASRANTRRGSRQQHRLPLRHGQRLLCPMAGPGADLFERALRAAAMNRSKRRRPPRSTASPRCSTCSPARRCSRSAAAGARCAGLAARHGARVTGLTLSTEQLAHAQAQVRAQGLVDVDLRLQDYRDVDGRYDRIVRSR